MSEIFPTSFLPECPLPPVLEAALARMKLESALPVQAKVLAAYRDGDRYMAMRAPTGSGKTLAFLLPLAQYLLDHPAAKALILSPTPELAMQNLQTLRALLPDLSTLGVIGAAGAARQLEALKKHPRVISATPGRWLEFVSMRKVSPRDYQALVMDEVDAILREESADTVQHMLPIHPGLVLAASASLAEHTVALLAEFYPAINALEDRTRTAEVSHWHVFSPADRKIFSLTRILRKAAVHKAIIFVNEGAHVPHVVRGLKDSGFEAVGLDAVRDRYARTAAIKAFRERKTNFYLVSTDLCARGLDIPGSDVIHFDLASRPETVAHRCGRTGRGTAAGRNIFIVAVVELYRLRQFTRHSGIVSQELPLDQEGERRPPSRSERGERKEERGERKEERGERKEERGERKEERGERKEERGERKEARGERKEERGERKRVKSEAPPAATNVPARVVASKHRKTPKPAGQKSSGPKPTGFWQNIPKKGKGPAKD